MEFRGDFEATKIVRMRISSLERDAQAQIRAMTELSDLHLTKEEKEVLEKWRAKWDAGLKRICKSIEKERKHLEKEYQKQQQKELEKIAKKDASKILFVSLPGKKEREEAARTVEFKQQQKLLRDTFNANLTTLERKIESQIYEHLQLLRSKISQYRVQVESRISKKKQYLKSLQEAPYLFYVTVCNGKEITGDPEQEIQFEVWIKDDRRTKLYIEQNEAALLSNDKNQCCLWSEAEFRQYLKSRRTYLEKCAHQKGFEEGRKAGYEKGFEAGRRAGLEARIDDETDEAFDILWQKGSEE